MDDLPCFEKLKCAKCSQEKSKMLCFSSKAIYCKECISQINKDSRAKGPKRIAARKWGTFILNAGSFKTVKES